MPPRHSYWTILIGGQPTAFRAAETEELLPTFNRLKDKHPDAVMKWFERGRLWDSREAAREEGRRDTQERRGPGWRPGGEHRDPREKYQLAKKAKWQRFKDKIRERHEGRGAKPFASQDRAKTGRFEGERRDERGTGRWPKQGRFDADRPGQTARPRDERAPGDRRSPDRQQKDRPREERAWRDRPREDRDRPFEKTGGWGGPKRQGWSGKPAPQGGAPKKWGSTGRPEPRGRDDWKRGGKQGSQERPDRPWSNRPREQRQQDRNGPKGPWQGNRGPRNSKPGGDRSARPPGGSPFKGGMPRPKSRGPRKPPKPRGGR